MITDVEFVRELDPEIGEEYRRAAEFVSVAPDYACQCLRQSVEALCRKLAEKNDLSFDNRKIFQRINVLFDHGILNEQNKDALHQVRMICNAGVHKNDAAAAIPGESKSEGGSGESKQKQVESVKTARDCFLSVAESVFSAFVTGKPIPTYSVIEIKTQEHKDIIYEACISGTPESKLKAGLLYEALGDEQSVVDLAEESPNSYTKKGLVVFEHVYRHFTYLYEQAAESYDSACYISAWETRKHKSFAQACLEGTGDDEDWLISVCDIEPLYRYGLLTCEGRLGDDKKALGIGRLKAAASRGHVEAAAACGTSLYNEGEFEAAHTYLVQAAKYDDVLALRMLFYYYSEGTAVPVDADVAVDYIQQAIEQGCPDALALWGQAHFEGIVVEKDADKGNAILRKAEQLGSSIAAQHFFSQKMAKKMQNHFAKVGKALLNGAQNRKLVAGGKNVGRNAPCPCGSGKKFKKCCLQ